MSDDKKTICLISPSLQMGGLERAMSNLAIYFNSQGYKVHYLLLYNFEKFYQLDSNIEIIEPHFDYSNTLKPLYYLRLLKYIRNQVKKVNPDYVLSFGDYHNSFVLLALYGLKTPVYVSDRSSPDKNFGKAFTLFKKWTYKRSAGIIAQTQRAANQKKRLLGKNANIAIIPNAIRKIERHELPKKRYILGVGRHYHVKGFDRLIKAFALVETDWQLVLAGGGGPESNTLKELVDTLNLSDKVVFLGKVNDIDRVFSESDIFVLTSRSEGFPNALCEAMASGLACISFDIVAGPADIIENGVDGILVENGNIEELAQKIQLCIDDELYRLSLGENALKIQQKFCLNTSGEKYLNFIINGFE